MTAILDYHTRLGGDTGLLGRAIGPEIPTGEGAGKMQDFERGRIYDAEGVHEVHGDILAAFKSPSLSLLSTLGHPLSDELNCHDQIGRMNLFERGVIYWHPTIGAKEVHGAILAKWRSLGSERSVLGYPISNEDGGSGWRRGRFQFGEIYWSPATGAREIHGEIWERWKAMNGLSGPGLPITDENPMLGGVGRISRFVNNWISWRPNTGITVGT